MARMTFKATDEYALKLSKLAAGSDEIAKKAIYAGAKIVADQIKTNLENVLSAESSGELLDSFGIARIDRDDNGDWNTKLGFDGYDASGTPNQLKARVLESGSSRQRKRPFVRPAVNTARAKAQKAMGDVIEQEIEKRMKQEG